MMSILERVISTDLIGDEAKNDLRKQAQDAQEIFSRRRGFATVMAMEIVISIIVIVLGIVLALTTGASMATWIAPLSIGFTLAIVFGILRSVYSKRFQARLSHLEADLLYQLKKGEGARFRVTPYLCVVGPYFGGYRGIPVFVKSSQEGPLPSYSNLSLTFIENRKGGEYVFTVKNKTARLEAKPNECLIVKSYIDGGRLLFRRKQVNLPEDSLTREEAVEVENTTLTEEKEAPATPKQNYVEKLREAKSLFDDGLITQEEFDKIKKNILEGAGMD